MEMTEQRVTELEDRFFKNYPTLMIRKKKNGHKQAK
jgi:hypothetical protein